VLTGRKLLLADDSAAIRKVIELTFSDEGMEVITVPDGRSAFEKMGQVRPDLVLADVYMPEINGLELCRFIKQDERFAKIPVMLLISSFEPFDEAEARRAGADDVVTKPFQSIRQLVSRVGSLLNKSDQESEMTHQYSTLGISENETVPPAPVEVRASEPHVAVMVEAPIMEHHEPEPAGVACSTDLDLQTADTMKLERIVDDPIVETIDDDSLSLEDTIEVEPVDAVASDQRVSVEPLPETVEVSYSDTNEPSVPPQPPSTMKLDDAVLDLEDEFLGEPQMVGDDVFLDLDFVDNVPAEAVEERVAEEPRAPLAFEESALVEQVSETEHAVAPAIAETPGIEVPEEPSTFEPLAPEALNEAVVAEPATAQLTTPEVEGLSPAAIEAIARRMVEQMSDKVIREIAWEVVPELSELLIKRKLEEQK
jgi:CheY-like chemotaxis protein